jgi:hypothetical protein
MLQSRATFGNMSLPDEIIEMTLWLVYHSLKQMIKQKFILTGISFFFFQFIFQQVQL